MGVMYAVDAFNNVALPEETLIEVMIVNQETLK